MNSERLKEAIETIEDECFTYADDLQLKEETYSCGVGVRKGALLALKHIKPLIAITALQEYQPWISVKDRLPERDGDYICCEDDIMAIFVACYSASGWQRPLYRDITVTHWKPLPEPPKGE